MMMSSSCASPSPGNSRAKTTKPGPKAQAEIKWRTAAQERIYGRRLLDALRANRASAEPRAIKEAADSALALTARGQSRWSRAILLGRRRRPRCKLLLKARRPRKRPPRPPPEPELDPAAAAVLGGKKARDRLLVLGRLVPGCRKLSAPTLLEEAADYVAALEMQVKAMRAITDALSATSLNAADPER